MEVCTEHFCVDVHFTVSQMLPSTKNQTSLSTTKVEEIQKNI